MIVYNFLYFMHQVFHIQNQENKFEKYIKLTFEKNKLHAACRLWKWCIKCMQDVTFALKYEQLKIKQSAVLKLLEGFNVILILKNKLYVMVK